MNTCRIPGVGVGLGLLLFAGSVLAQDADKPLRYQFKQGQKLNYALDQKIDMAMSVAGNNIDMGMSQEMDLTWEVTKVNADGSARITQKFGRIRFGMNSPMGKMEFDTDKELQTDDPVGQIMAPLLKAMAGSSVEMTMSPRGELSEFKMSEKYKEAIKNIPPAPGLTELMSEDNLKKMMTQSAVILPTGAPKKGTSWENKVEVKTPQIGKMITNTKTTYDGQIQSGGKSLARMLLEPKLTIEAEKNAAIEMKVKSQDVEGAALFDNQTGRLVETSLTQNVQMEMSVMGQNVSQNMKTTTTMKLKNSK